MSRWPVVLLTSKDGQHSIIIHQNYWDAHRAELSEDWDLVDE